MGYCEKDEELDWIKPQNQASFGRPLGDEGLYKLEVWYLPVTERIKT